MYTDSINVDDVTFPVVVLTGTAALPDTNKGDGDDQYIHPYSHKLQLQKQEIKKTKEKDTHNVSKNTTCQRVKCILTMHSGSAR